MIIAAMSYTVHPSAQISTTRKGSQAPGIPGAWFLLSICCPTPGQIAPGSFAISHLQRHAAIMPLVPSFCG
jgi:hypothetical protein